MTSQVTECRCGKPIGSTAALCKACRRTLEYAIAHVGVYYAELSTLKAKQTRFRPMVQTSTRTADVEQREPGKKGLRFGAAEKPLGMDARFASKATGSVTEHEARNTVSTWCRYVLDYITTVEGPTCSIRCEHRSCRDIRRTRAPQDTVGSMCAFLLRWSDWLRTAAVGPEVLDDMKHAEATLRRLIDRPADRWYAGTCTVEDDHGRECGADLYAFSDFGDVVCPSCGSVYDVKERREWLLEAVEDRAATAHVIARAITALSEHSRDEGKLAARIRQWGSRNRIMAVRHDHIDGIPRPLYRVGDVLDLLAADMRMAVEKRQRNEARKERVAARKAAEEKRLAEKQKTSETEQVTAS